MFDKIKTIPKHPYWQSLRDVRALGFVVFGILVLLASWSGVRVIETNYELQKQIAQLDEQNKVWELQNSNLKLQNQYYETDTFLELTARKQLGKGAPGENLILVPKSVALAKVKQLPEDEKSQPDSELNESEASDKKPSGWQNFNAWLDFILHRAS